MASIQVPKYFVDIMGFGAAEDVYSLRRRARWGGLAGMIVLLLISAAVLVGGIWYTYLQVDRHGPAIMQRTLLAPLVLSAVMLILGLIALWSVYTNWRKAVVVYESGFAYSDRKGVKSTRWDEISALQSAIIRRYMNGIYTGTSHRYIVEKQDGDKIVLDDNLDRVEILANLIQEKTFPILYERASRAYNRGHPVVFGPVTIQRGEGIKVGRKHHPWDEIEAVSIQDGLVQFSKKGGGFFSRSGVQAARVPNLAVLLSIIEQVLGDETDT